MSGIARPSARKSATNIALVGLLAAGCTDSPDVVRQSFGVIAVKQTGASSSDLGRTRQSPDSANTGSDQAKQSIDLASTLSAATKQSQIGTNGQGLGASTQFSGATLVSSNPGGLVSTNPGGLHTLFAFRAHANFLPGVDLTSGIPLTNGAALVANNVNSLASGASLVSSNTNALTNGSALAANNVAGLTNGAALNPTRVQDLATNIVQPVLQLAPMEYSVALIGMTLEKSDGTAIPFFYHRDFASSSVLTFTPSQTDLSIATSSIPAGTYTGIAVEIYYVQTKIQVDGKPQRLRVYLTDDDFPEQTSHVGSGPHHQGDVTFIDQDGTERGWVNPTSGFIPGPRATPTGRQQFFGARRDPLTLHDRGPFGDDNLWLADDSQSSAAIPAATVSNNVVVPFPYYVAQQLDRPLVVSDGSTDNGVSLILGIPYSWAYSDVGADDDPASPSFDPGTKDARGVNDSWNPILPVFRFQ